ncbi:MAG: hypothetical protein VB111_07895 [Clostridiaceae bacterium]|nr:hypothetical protein [Clostridiaceae bacterium]
MPRRLLWLIVSLLLLCACAAAPSQTAVARLDAALAYRSDTLETPLTFISNTMPTGDGQLWMITAKDGVLGTYFVDAEGNSTRFPYEISGDAHPTLLLPGKDGEPLWLVESVRRNSSYVSHTLVRLDNTGTELARADVTELYGENGEAFTNPVAVQDGEGTAWLYAGGRLAAYGADGKRRLSVAVTGVTALARLSDGRAAAAVARPDGAVMCICDADTRNGFSQTYSTGYTRLAPGDSVYDLYLYGSDAAGFTLSDASVTRLFAFSDADAIAEEITALASGLSGGEPTLCYAYNDGGTLSLRILRRATAEERKTVLTIGVTGNNRDLKAAILRFNMQSADYRVELADYSVYNTDDGWREGEDRLHLDMIAGKCPDMLELRYLPYKSYMDKGLLLDLSAYVDGDTELGGILPNIRVLWEYKDKLAGISPRFLISTMSALPEVVGNRADDGLRVEEFAMLLDENPGVIQPVANIPRAKAFDFFAFTVQAAFVDYENGVCDFENEGFYKILELCARFPETIEDLEESAVDRLLDGRALLKMEAYSSVDSYQISCQTLDGGLTVTGYPSEDGVGTIAQVMELYGITTACERPDAAWAFLHFLITDDESYFQVLGSDNGIHRYHYIPAWEKPYADMLAEAQVNYYNIVDGVRVEQARTRYTRDNTYHYIYAATPEIITTFDALVRSIRYGDYRDNTILDIIYDELPAYYAGVRTCEETAALIQSRVSVYLAEGQ